MSLSTASVTALQTVLSGVSALATGIVKVKANLETLWEIGKAAIVKAEANFASIVNSGATKKEIVMSVISMAAEELGEVWADLKDYFSALIDSVIDLFNHAKTVVADAKTAAASVATDVKADAAAVVAPAATADDSTVVADADSAIPATA